MVKVEADHSSHRQKVLRVPCNASATDLPNSARFWWKSQSYRIENLLGPTKTGGQAATCQQLSQAPVRLEHNISTIEDAPMTVLAMVMLKMVVPLEPFSAHGSRPLRCAGQLLSLCAASAGQCPAVLQ